jgi:hypothetical protein
MPRKKAVEVKPELEIKTVEDVAEPELVDVTDVVGEIEKAGETVEMIWVETVDEIGRHMIQVPKWE